MTGSRSRSVGKSISYLALGDSLTAGVGAFGSGGFVRAYGLTAGEALNRPVETGVIGIPGATTGELRMLLERSPQLRDMAREAQLLTLTAGGNDLIDAAKRFAADRDTGRLAAALERCHEDYAALLQALRRLQQGGAALQPPARGAGGRRLGEAVQPAARQPGGRQREVRVPLRAV
ncbi:lysophospholipase L1-like esterase [Paenibacillus mucilaginosus]|uniref:GDSL-type esterase/lipase family protein n=1 Tax=Paenibacillus mucilaginosus TaxID=61624 RepID=UPI003D25FDBB